MAQILNVNLNTLPEKEKRFLESSPLLVSSGGYNNTNAQSQNGNVAGGDVANNITLTGFSVPPTRRYYVQSIDIYSSVTAEFNLTAGNGSLIPSGSTSQRTISVKVLAGSTIVVPYDDFVVERSGFFLTTAAPIVGGGNFRCGFTINGATNVVNDPNINAPVTIGMIGDSIWTAQGPTYGNQFSPFLFRDWYISGQGPSNKRVDARLVIKGQGGYAMSNILEMLNTQYLLMGKIDMLAINIGMNDAAAYAANPAAFQAGYATIYAWIKTFYPSIPVMFCGPSPRQDGLELTGLVPMRTWLSSYVSGLNDATIRYCNLANGFDRTVNANYTDGTGSNGIHPSALGHGIMYNNMKVSAQASPSIALS